MPTPRQTGFDLFARPSKPRVLSVSELTRQVKGMLEGRFSRIWVSGEVSGCRKQSSGHVYLTLKDDGASLQAVCFRGQARRLRFDLKDGMEVLVAGSLSVYAPRGQYQLVVDHIEPKGLGALQAAFEELKAKLGREGLFDAGRKKALPFLPKRIGVVTSPTGAAVHDFLRVLGRRNPRVSVLIAPAKVQGEGAASEVARALARLDARGDLDVLVVTRGGGSIEDLWAFNEEELARAMAACVTPVVSAVGHEVDLTISDMVADLRAPTPSAAAEILVPERRELLASLQGLTERLTGAMRARLEQRRSALAAKWASAPDPARLLIDRRLELEGLREGMEASLRATLRLRHRRLSAAREALERQHPRARLQRLSRELSDLERRSARCVAGALRFETGRLRMLSDAIGEHHPRRRIEEERGKLGKLSMRLSAAVTRDIGEGRRAHAGLAGKLDALSPLRVLDRGYAIVRAPGERVIRSATDVSSGEDLDIRLARGRLLARVLETEPEKPDREPTEEEADGGRGFADES